VNGRQDDPRALARQANHWLTKRDAGLMTPQDIADLHAWLEANPSHAQAYGHAETIFNAIAALPPSTSTVPPLSGLSRRRRWTVSGKAAGLRWTGYAVAASLAALAFIGADLPMRMRADAIAATGESRRVVLPDGSIALLDSGSALAIAYGAERRIKLLRGQAAFTVTADPKHAFVVEARDGTTTALGTRFIVSRIMPTTRVTVAEHSVRIAYGGASEVVHEGASASYSQHGITKPAAVHVPEIDAWTRGRIRFVNRPLHEVVAELGRYHRGYIGMVGGGLGNLRVNGVFSTSDPVGALDIIQRSLGLSSYRVGNRLILLHG